MSTLIPHLIFTRYLTRQSLQIHTHISTKLHDTDIYFNMNAQPLSRPQLHQHGPSRKSTRFEHAKTPVTPGISLGTYTESPSDSTPRLAASYFPSADQLSCSNLTLSESDSSIETDYKQSHLNGTQSYFNGTVISATFVLPQILQLDRNQEWVCSI